MGVQVRFFAAAREAMGAAEVELPAGSVAELCAALITAGGPRMAEVLAVSSLACEGRIYRCGDESPIPDGQVLDVLPPFAGG